MLRSKWMIDPEEPWKLLWNLLVSVFALYSLVTAPLFLALGPQHDAPLAGEILVSLVFLADMVLNFFTAYYKGIHLENNPAKIRRHYLLSWFLPDLLAAFPFFLLPGGVGSVFRMTRLFRLARILKVFTLFQTINRIRKKKIGSNSIRIYIMLFWLLLTAHLIACGFMAVGGIAENMDPAMRYLQSFYWTITTLATVGYGDFTPDKNNPVQLLYTILSQMVGVGMYGYVIGSITSVISNLDISKARFMERMEKINAFLAYQNISDELVKRVNQYYHYLWKTRRGHENSEILQGLPQSLRIQISREIHQDIILRVPLFQNAGPSLLKDVLLHLEPVVFLPGDVVVRRGELGEEMFFINRGMVYVMGEDEKSVMVTLSSGAFFGEMALLFSAPRNATIVARDYCDMYILSKSAFDRVLAYHPEFARSVQAMAEDRQKSHSG